MDTVDDKNDGERRKFLKVLVGTGSLAFGGALVAPAAIFVAAPVKVHGGNAARWVKTVRLDSLSTKEPKKIAIVSEEHDAWTVSRDVELGAVWLLRDGDKVKAFSVVCPHLGCSINADPGGTGFSCPCHTSAFNADGTKKGGPTPRGMDALETRVEDGFVHVDFRRFRIGIENREEIG
jgi:cytochrome b6-f complex iron-sulfur subunit/menaquinol-cytochrome c reductase iron-sulfur subunit